MLIKLKNYYRKYRLRIQMIIANAIIAIVPIILVGLVSYTINYNNVRNNISNSVSILFGQVGSRLEVYFDDVDLLTRAVFFSGYMQKTTIDENDELPWMNYETTTEYLNTYVNNYKYIKGIELFGYNGNNYSSNSFILNRSMLDYIDNFDAEKLKCGRLFFSGPFKAGFSTPSVYLGIRGVKSVLGEKYLENIAVGVIVLDLEFINSLMTSNGLVPGSELFILGENNCIIASTDRKKVGGTLNEFLPTSTPNGNIQKIHNTEYLVMSTELKRVGWKLVAFIPENQLFKEGRVIKYSILVSVALIFVFVVVINLFFNIMITKPLKKLSDAFDKAASGDLRANLVFSNKNEITVIADNFNNMITEIKTLTKNIVTTQERLYETELEKRQFELNGLQSQINSHFLYNTLNCIRGMALSNAAEQVSSMIQNLVLYLRYTAKMDEYISLSEELTHLETYMEIQNARFKNKFKVVFDVQDDLKSYRILKLTLQPLVENAIFHGIEQKFGKGIIKVIAFRQGENVIFKVMDNGIGMEKEKVQELNNMLGSMDTPPIVKNERRSIGIINIKKRISVYYGAEYGLSVKSWRNIGSVFILKLPYSEGV